MTREEFIGKLQMVYVGDKNAFNDIVCVYDRMLCRVDKAMEYISNKKAIINTDVIRIFDLFEIDEQGYIDELSNILKGSDTH